MKPVRLGLALMLCVVFLVTMLGCAGNRTRESSGEYLDDNVITAKVKAALLANPDVSAFQVNVETFKGVVQLSGFVDTAAHIRKAVEIAKGVQGVRSVKNSMLVK